jgi:hypothetical protein
MPDDQQDQQTADDQSTTAESEEQPSQDEVMNESARETTDGQEGEDTGAAGTDANCPGWFSDAESISNRAAEFFVRNELTGDRGMVKKIDVQGRDNPDGYTCNVHFSDKKTNIEVVVLRKETIVREALPDISDRWTCWYEYKCPRPDRDLLLTKRQCKMMAPIILGPASMIGTRRNCVRLDGY